MQKGKPPEQRSLERRAQQAQQRPRSKGRIILGISERPGVHDGSRKISPPAAFFGEPRMLREVIPLNVQQAILGVPDVNLRPVPNAPADAIDQFEAMVREKPLPIRRPLFVHMMQATLVRN